MGRNIKTFFAVLSISAGLCFLLQGLFNIPVKHTHQGHEGLIAKKKEEASTTRVAGAGSYRIIKSHENDHSIYKFPTEYTNSLQALLSNMNSTVGSNLAPIGSDQQHDVTTYQAPVNELVITKEHQARIDHLKATCKGHSHIRYREQRKGNLTQFFYSKEYRFAYCKVPKSGSTFWMKLFMALNKGDDYSRIMSLWSRAQIHEKTKRFETHPLSLLRVNMRTVVVSRNPYSRLFSAYVDKVFMPFFWEQFVRMESVKQLEPFYINYTKEVLKKSKRQLSGHLFKYVDTLREKGLLTKLNISVKVTPTCLNNASFEHFLRFIISEVKAGRTLEPHWAPISHLCRPCRFNTYKVVKQESFNTDVKHVLKSFGVDLSKYAYLMNSLTEDRAKVSIPSIIGVVDTKIKTHAVNSCITHEEIVKRMWKSFQIQGFISNDIELPDNLITADKKFDRWKTTGAALDAITKRPMTSSDSENQRHDYLVKAYADVSDQTIKDIQAIYNQDFVLFNYSFKSPV